MVSTLAAESSSSQLCNGNRGKVQRKIDRKSSGSAAYMPSHLVCSCADVALHDAWDHGVYYIAITHTDL